MGRLVSKIQTRCKCITTKTYEGKLSYSLGSGEGLRYTGFSSLTFKGFQIFRTNELQNTQFLFT